MIDVQIQIVNYKTKEYLLACLKTICSDLHGSALSYCITILDNASGDDLSDIPALFPDQPVSVVVSETNRGFGAGHNLLARGASARYILLLNPDTRLIEANTVARLLDRSRSDTADIVGPRLVTQDGTTQLYDHGELSGLYARFVASMGRSYWKERRAPLPVAWVSGAVLLVRTETFRTLGGFDESFFLYKEEEDLCLRLRQQGGTVVYDPTVTVFHHGSVVAKKTDHMKKSITHFTKKTFWCAPTLSSSEVG